jgi:hypothetical protein
MKLQLTPQAEQELAAINQRIDEAGDEGYDDMCESLNRREQLITDAGMYVNEAYVDNIFSNLDVWCEETGKEEVCNDYKMRVKRNIGQMLMEDIITIVD